MGRGAGTHDACRGRCRSGGVSRAGGPGLAIPVLVPQAASPLWPATSSGWAPSPLPSSQGPRRSRVPTSPMTASPPSTQTCAPNKRRQYGHCGATCLKDSPPSSTAACNGARLTVTRMRRRCFRISSGTVGSRAADDKFFHGSRPHWARGRIRRCQPGPGHCGVGNAPWSEMCCGRARGFTAVHK